jgi:hypothetical protein
MQDHAGVAGDDRRAGHVDRRGMLVERLLESVERRQERCDRLPFTGVSRRKACYQATQAVTID